MGLTFKKNDDLERMLDKFAVLPDDDKAKSKKQPKDDKENKEKKD